MIDWPYVIVAVVGLLLGWVARTVTGKMGLKCRTRFKAKLRLNPTVKPADEPVEVAEHHPPPAPRSVVH